MVEHFVYTKITLVQFWHSLLKYHTLVILTLWTIVPILIAVAFFTLAERKIMAFIQRRKGPDVVGFWGLLQPIADALKLIIADFTSTPPVPPFPMPRTFQNMTHSWRSTSKEEEFASPTWDLLTGQKGGGRGMLRKAQTRAIFTRSFCYSAIL